MFSPEWSSNGGPLVGAGQWLEAQLAGPLVTTIAVLAVAFVGYEALSGRTSMKTAARVAIGCFVLFAAPSIARTLMEAARSGTPAQLEQPSHPLPPALPEFSADRRANPFDPYAGKRPAN